MRLGCNYDFHAVHYLKLIIIKPHDLKVVKHEDEDIDGDGLIIISNIVTIGK